MVLPEVCGGHFATEEILKNIGAHTYQMVCDSQNLCVNSKKTLQLIESEKINYVFVDRSEGLYYEDFSWLKDSYPCYKILMPLNILVLSYANDSLILLTWDLI